jgi:hypothetical protein
MGQCYVTCNGQRQRERAASYDDLVNLLQMKYGPGYLGQREKDRFVRFDNRARAIHESSARGRF